jgi:hypothetical protein
VRIHVTSAGLLPLGGEREATARYQFLGGVGAILIDAPEASQRGRDSIQPAIKATGRSLVAPTTRARRKGILSALAFTAAALCAPQMAAQTYQFVGTDNIHIPLVASDLTTVTFAITNLPAPTREPSGAGPSQMARSQVCQETRLP